jgi:nitrate reductase gamma subunit
MYSFNEIAFVIFPYVALTLFVVGHLYRYSTDLYHWNSRSSELLDKGSLRYGITIFHWGIIITFLGHLSGLLTPQWFLTRIGISAELHDFLALFVGKIVGLMAAVGLTLLLVRRLGRPRIARNSSWNDLAIVVFLLAVVSLGTFNAWVPRCDVLHTVAPWIRSILTFAPQPQLMESVPGTYRIHVIAALAVLAFSPFTRLVHIWSVPIPYLFRRYVVFRRREASVC